MVTQNSVYIIWLKKPYYFTKIGGRYRDGFTNNALCDGDNPVEKIFI